MLTCRCGWYQSIPSDSPYHWMISEHLPRCPRRRWWNGWKHREYTILPTIHAIDPWGNALGPDYRPL